MTGVPPPPPPPPPLPPHDARTHLAQDVKSYLDSRGLVQISDPAAIGAMLDEVLAASPKQLAEYRGGKTKLQGYFVGQAMKASKGRANPELMNSILLQKLNAE